MPVGQLARYAHRVVETYSAIAIQFSQIIVQSFTAWTILCFPKQIHFSLPARSATFCTISDGPVQNKQQQQQQKTHTQIKTHNGWVLEYSMASIMKMLIRFGGETGLLTDHPPFCKWTDQSLLVR